MAGLTVETFPANTSAAPLHATAPAGRRGAAVAGAQWTVLSDILRPEVNLAIWHRELPASLTPGLRGVCKAAPFTSVAEDAPGPAADALASRLPAAAPLDLLLDIHRLAVIFAAIADVRAVRIRLEAITGPACHRWHADAVGLRLLCTYRGRGTEWLPLAGGARTARAIDPSHLPCPRATIATGAIAILKGEGFRGNAGSGCIHRSPPAGPGERARLLLCIDEPGRIPLE